MDTSSRHLFEIHIIMLFSLIHAQTTNEMFTDANGHSSSTKVSTSYTLQHTTSLPSTLPPRILNMVSTRIEKQLTMGQSLTTDRTSRRNSNEGHTPLPLAVSLAVTLVVAMAVVIICVVRIKHKRRLRKDSWIRTSKVQKGVNSAENGLSNSAYDVGPTETKERQNRSIYQRGKDLLSFRPIDGRPFQDQDGSAPSPMDSIGSQAPVEITANSTAANHKSKSNCHQIQAIQSSIVIRHHMAIVDTDDDADSVNDYVSDDSFDDEYDLEPSTSAGMPISTNDANILPNIKAYECA